MSDYYTNLANQRRRAAVVSEPRPQSAGETVMVCRHCGCRVGWWQSFGSKPYLKHQASGRRKSCGRKLTPADVVGVQRVKG